jgi:hypothetical protein
LVPSNLSPVIARASLINYLNSDFNGFNRPNPIGSNPDIGAIESNLSQTIPSLDSVTNNSDTFFIYAKIWQPEYRKNLYLEITDDKNNLVKIDSVASQLGKFNYQFKEGYLENGKLYNFRVYQGNSSTDRISLTTNFSNSITKLIPLTSFNCRGLKDSVFSTSKLQCIRGNKFTFINRSKETAGYKIVSSEWSYWNSFSKPQTSLKDTLKISFVDSGTQFIALIVKNNKGVSN